MRIYYGWYIVAIAVFVNMVTFSSSFLAFGLFVVPVSEDMNLSRASMNTALILLNFGSALAAPFVGRMLDNYSLKRIMLISAMICGTSLVVLGLSRNIWLSALIIACPLAAATLGAAVLSVNTIVTRWFKVYRGRALAIAAIGMSMGSVIVVPLIGLLIENVGWRQTLIIMGLVYLVTILPVMMFIRNKPGANDIEVKESNPLSQAELEADAESPAEENATVLSAPEILRMPLFWTIILSAAIAAGVMQTVVISMAPLALDNGMSMTQAAGLMSILGASGIFGKLCLAWIADRVGRMTLLASLFLVLAFANTLLLVLGDSYALLAICCVTIGLASGAVVPAFMALLADVFGQASFGSANGLVLPVKVVMGAVFVRYSGEVFDRTDSYDFMFASFIVASLAAAAMMFAFGSFSVP